MATFVLPAALALQPHLLHSFLLAQDYQQHVDSDTVAVVIAAAVIAAAVAAADAATVAVAVAVAVAGPAAAVAAVSS